MRRILRQDKEWYIRKGTAEHVVLSTAGKFRSKAGRYRIGSVFFNSCIRLLYSSLTLPSAAQYSTLSFSEDQSLRSIVIPNGVTVIYNRTFFKCSNLTSVTLPDGLKHIGICAFAGCHSLAHISIPPSVNTISVSAFSSCLSLERIVIPEGITSIGRDAFAWCVHLKEIRLPQSLTFLSIDVFRQCRSLQHITIPDKVTSCSSQHFVSCSNLRSIILPSSVKSLELWSFHPRCTLLQAPGIHLPDIRHEALLLALLRGYMANPAAYGRHRRIRYKAALRQKGAAVLSTVIRNDDVRFLDLCARRWHWLLTGNYDTLITQAAEAQSFNVLAWLLEYKHRTLDRSNQDPLSALEPLDNGDESSPHTGEDDV